MKNCLVTGASGFIGRNLCQRLSNDGLFVRGLMRHECNGPWHQALTCDLAHTPIPPEALADIDTIFHLAGHAHTSSALPNAYEQDNVETTRQLLTATSDTPVQRLIYFSSVKVIDYLNGQDYSDYARSKHQAEQLVLGCRGIDHRVVLRPSLVYGPGHRGNLERLSRAIAKHHLPPLPDTHNRRALVDVRDLVSAALLVARHPQTHLRCLNISDGQAYSTHALYLAILHALGRPTPRWSTPYGLLQLIARTGDLLGHVMTHPAPLNSMVLEKLLGSAWYDPDPLLKELGFKPQYRFETAVGDMLQGFAL